ncbi:hypothetical protein [Brachyspira hampsonii]|nr:hypothetical protein [Brachyspira hampsonii]ELV06168.1 hypothetical protein H263_05852 [Brachyspira hampsonii 30599]
MEKEEKFNPSWWVIIREGKKYIGCSNNCEHLEEKKWQNEMLLF